MARTVAIFPNSTRVLRAASASPNAHDALTSKVGDSTVQFYSSFETPRVLTDLAYFDTQGRDMPGYPIKQNERVARIRVRANYSTGNGSITFHGGVRLDDNEPTWGSFYDTSPRYPEATTVGNWIQHPANSTGWTQSEMDRLTLELKDLNGGSSLPRIFWADVQLDVRTRPSVHISYPHPSFPTDQGFPVQWYIDANGDSQKSYRVKVFTRAIANGLGFNPDLSGSVFDSGVRNGSSGTLQIPFDVLDYGQEYVVFVQASTDFLGAHWWSNWAGQPFQVNSRPVVNVQGPSGVVTTSKPTVRWSYSDAEGDQYRAYSVRIYKQPAVGWDGFDPDWDPDRDYVGKSSLTQDLHYTPEANLDNDTNYRAYVRVWQDRHNIWSEWGYSEFNTDYVEPAVPNIVVTPHDQGESHFQITLTPGSGVDVAATEYFNVQKSEDGGQTWTTLRSGSQRAYSGSPVNVFEYEASLYKEILFRAEAGSNSSGVPVSSGWATATGQLANPKVWLKNPLNPAVNRSFPVEDKWITRIRGKVRGVHRPLGRTLPVVKSGLNNGETLSASFLIIGHEAVAELEELIDSEETLLLQTAGVQWYVRVAGDVEVLDHLWDELVGEDPVFKYRVPFIEVDSPEGSFVEPEVEDPEATSAPYTLTEPTAGGDPTVDEVVYGTTGDYGGTEPLAISIQWQEDI